MAQAFASYFEGKVRIAAGRGLSLYRYLEIGRQRRRLARLDARLLDDIGRTRDEAMREARRPFWDVPTHWQQ